MKTMHTSASYRDLRTRFGLAALLMLLGAVHAGAGLAHAQDNPFAGAWSGTAELVGYGFAGTTEWSIDDSGRFTGTAHRTIDDSDLTIVGHVATDGRIELTFNSEGGGGGSGDPWRGSGTLNANGQLVAQIAATYGKSPHFQGLQLIITLDRVH